MQLLTSQHCQDLPAQITLSRRSDDGWNDAVTVPAGGMKVRRVPYEAGIACIKPARRTPSKAVLRPNRRLQAPAIMVDALESRL